MKYFLIFSLFSILFFSCAEHDGSFKDTSKLPDLTPETTATYKVEFISNWNNSDFPNDYPAVTSYSNMLLMTHNLNAEMFAVGKTASTGINSMAVDGDNTILITELENYKNDGNAEWYDFGPQNTTTPNLENSFTINSKRPMVSFCVKMTPSPNWFLGLSNYSLLKTDGTWIAAANIAVVAYDNDGTTLPTTTYNSGYAFNASGVITAINPTVLTPAVVIGSLKFTKQ